MKKKKRAGRIAAFLLVFAMLFSLFPSALAEEVGVQASDQTDVQSQEEETGQDQAALDAGEAGGNPAAEASLSEENENAGISAQADSYGSLTYTVKVVDQNGNPVPNVPVTVSARRQLNTRPTTTFNITPNPVVTDANGEA